MQHGARPAARPAPPPTPAGVRHRRGPRAGARNRLHHGDLQRAAGGAAADVAAAAFRAPGQPVRRSAAGPRRFPLRPRRPRPERAGPLVRVGLGGLRHAAGADRHRSARARDRLGDGQRLVQGPAGLGEDRPAVRSRLVGRGGPLRAALAAGVRRRSCRARTHADGGRSAANDRRGPSRRRGRPGAARAVGFHDRQAPHHARIPPGCRHARRTLPDGNCPAASRRPDRPGPGGAGHALLAARRGVPFHQQGPPAGARTSPACSSREPPPASAIWRSARLWAHPAASSRGRS